MGCVIEFYDPGQETGWAGGIDGELLGCALIRVYRDRPLALAPRLPGGKAWIELPEYRRANNKVDPNDLISLGVKVGRIKEQCLGWGYEVYEVHPSTWKGGIPKEIHHKRILGLLRSSEMRAVHHGLQNVPESFQHNVLDAVGGFLWAARKEGLR